MLGGEGRDRAPSVTGTSVSYQVGPALGFLFKACLFNWGSLLFYRAAADLRICEPLVSSALVLHPQNASHAREEAEQRHVLFFYAQWDEGKGTNKLQS